MTMQGLHSTSISCPYCGEVFDAIIDCSVAQQAYIEDCEICCRPINFDVSVSPDDEVAVNVSHENE